MDVAVKNNKDLSKPDNKKSDKKTGKVKNKKNIKPKNHLRDKKSDKKLVKKKENGAIKWGKEVRGELKKVVWPKFTKLRSDSFIVFASMLLVGTLIWIIDSIFLKIFSFLITNT